MVHAKSEKLNASKLDLVYKVFPLPESMFSYIWDYGSLPKNEELQYIRKIIEKTNKSLTNLTMLIPTEINALSDIVSFAQVFTKKEESDWAVSLRDVNRFTSLFEYFAFNNFRKTEEFRTRQPNFKDTDKTRAIVLSLAFCYFFRIASN